MVFQQRVEKLVRVLARKAEIAWLKGESTALSQIVNAVNKVADSYEMSVISSVYCEYLASFE